MAKTPVSWTEYKVLEAMARAGVRGGPIGEVASRIGVPESTLHSVARLLEEKGLARVRVEEGERLELTERGQEALREGLPEEKLVRLLEEKGGEASIEEVRERLGREAGVAIGQARRQGLVQVEAGRVKLTGAKPGLRQALEAVAQGRPPGEALGELLSRGLARRVKVRREVLELAGDPSSLLDRVEVEASRLTHDMLASGEWRRYRFRPYNVGAEPPRVMPARIHFLTDFIEMLRDLMKEMGFTEARGPIVELELFNFDLLFQAQDHPAREIHDTLWVEAPPAGLEEYGELVERTRKAHEEGWGYRWSPEVAARLVLRSQTTSVSARLLAARPSPPIRFFTLGRVYRSDVVDATHLPEFHQLDGIEGYSGYTFRDLLGTLREIFERLGLQVKFKPAYFPFTEPSVEGYVRLPSGRWLELFGAGLFRPEVLYMAGVDYPVGAWGFGVERLAAAFYGISDIRLLYTRDTMYIRSFPVRVV
ncbi:MAG: phenylalanine--tRNA ligase subunit alpha [Desulfurococcales archaeon]|nr:phenylalanine--tRNA ligase subunit alpha [Desulfurococcales archaeon]